MEVEVELEVELEVVEEQSDKQDDRLDIACKALVRHGVYELQCFNKPFLQCLLRQNLYSAVWDLTVSH